MAPETPPGAGECQSSLIESEWSVCSMCSEVDACGGYSLGIVGFPKLGLVATFGA